MKRYAVPVILALSLVGLTAAGGVPPGSAQPLLSFDSLFAIEGAWLSPANAINGVHGDDMPWVIRSAKGLLRSNGRLELLVEGLVLGQDDSVPTDMQGKNPERTLRVLVSCITEGKNHHTVQETVLSEPFDVNVDGDGELDTAIELPDPCVAPILFVVTDEDEEWVAVTGIASDPD